MDISIYISIGSFIVALAALYISFKKYRIEILINKKANIRAKATKVVNPPANYWKVKIINEGQATAKNIRLVAYMGANDGIRFTGVKEKFPYPILNKGDSFEIVATLWGTPNPVPIIKFIWDDEFKKDNEREQVLEF